MPPLVQLLYNIYNSDAARLHDLVSDVADELLCHYEDCRLNRLPLENAVHKLLAAMGRPVKGLNTLTDAQLIEYSLGLMIHNFYTPAH